MGRRESGRAVYYGAMQAPRNSSVELLLRADNTERVRSVAHETCRRDLHGQALLWVSKHYSHSAEGRARRQSKAHSTSHAALGIGGESTGPKYLQEQTRASQIPISAAWARNSSASPCVEHGYHVHSVARRLRVPCSRDRLVQSIGARIPALKQPGSGFLRRSVRSGDPGIRAARNFQHRSRRAIHISGICECRTQQKYSLQYGRPRKGARQYFCGTSMEICKI